MKISILLILIIINVKLIESQNFAQKCIKKLENPLDSQSFPNETIYYRFLDSIKGQFGDYMSFGSPILGIVKHYTNKKFKRRLSVSISQRKLTENEKRTWRQVFGETFMGEAFMADERFEWICPANFYQSIFDQKLNLSEVTKDKDKAKRRYRNSEMPLNHNYFVNMRLNKNLKVFAGHGAIVVHSVDLNEKTLEIVQDTSFNQSMLAAESLPSIQITNNYGKGKIIIETPYDPKNHIHRRSIIHGGNDKNIEIQFKKNEKHNDDFDFKLNHFDIAKPPNDANYKETPKSGEESEKRPKKSKSLSRSDIFIYIGLACFVLSLVFLILPFFVQKDNDFYLLEHYDYYQDCDELQ